MDETITGIILKAFPYQDYHRILTLFTQELGLIKVFVNYASHPSSMQKTLFLQPFCKIELMAGRGKGDLYYYKEASLMENVYSRCPQEEARNFLISGSQLCQCILLSQMPEKPAPKLFLLMDAYLRRLAICQRPSEKGPNLISSLQMKILAHDGLFTPNERCSHCGNPSKEFHISYRGELFCKEHAPFGTFSLNESETRELLTLSTSRSLDAICALQISTSLSDKIQRIFEEAIQN